MFIIFTVLLIRFPYNQNYFIVLTKHFEFELTKLNKYLFVCALVLLSLTKIIFPTHYNFSFQPIRLFIRV